MTSFCLQTCWRPTESAGGVEKALYVELVVGHEFTLAEALSLAVGATVGYVEPNEGESGFSHYTGMLAAVYRGVQVSVTYVGQIDEEVKKYTGADAFGLDAMEAVKLTQGWIGG